MLRWFVVALAWIRLFEANSNYGMGIDPNGATADSDKGMSIDPNG
jgi:hypothetical protein